MENLILDGAEILGKVEMGHDNIFHPKSLVESKNLKIGDYNIFSENSVIG